MDSISPSLSSEDVVALSFALVVLTIEALLDAVLELSDRSQVFTMEALFDAVLELNDLSQV